MAVRSVSVRYSASVGAAVRELDRYAKANDKVAQSAERAGRATDKSAKSAERTKVSADKLALAGGAVALGLGVAVAKFAEFDAAMSQAQAASSTTGAELNALRDAAIQAGQDTQYSATQAAQGITELSKAGVATADILGGGLTGALNLAAAGQIEVADAAEIAATALTQFKLQGDDVTHVADLLAAGANKAQGGVGDLGMALKQSGLVASQTGLSIEETTAALTSFASAGLIGSDAGTSLKTMLQRLTPQSDQAAGLMEELGISAYDAAGQFIGLEKFAGNLRESMQDLTPEQRAAANAVIFGSDAVRAANVLYDEGATGIRKWTEEVNQQGYAAQQAAVLTDNLKGDLERLGGAFDTNLIQAGSGANNTMRTLVQTGEGLLDILGAIPGPVLTGVAAFTALTLLGPKVATFGNAFSGAVGPSMRGGVENIRLAGLYASEAQGPVRKLSVGVRTLGSSMGGLKGAAGGVMGLLGGPWGVALTAATAGITIWAQKQADARAAADALSATIDEQTGKFTDSSKATVLSAFADALSPEDQARIQQLGVNLQEASDAALKGGPAFDAYRDRLRALAAEKAGFFGTDDSRLLDAFTNALDVQGDAAEVAAAKQVILNDAKRKAAVADSDMAGSAAAAERGILEVGSAADDTAGKLDDGGDAADSMSTLIAKLGGKSEETAEALKGLDTALDLLGGGDRALSAALDQQAASIDKVREAAEKAEEASAGGKGGGAASRALDKALLARTQAQERLNAVEAKGTQSQRIAARQALARAELAVAQAQDRVTESGKTAGEVAREKAEAERELRAALREVATDTIARLQVMKDENASVKDLTAAYELGRAAIEKQLYAQGLRGEALQRETDEIIGTRDAFRLILEEYAKTPGQIATHVKTTGTETAKENIRMVIKTINGVPTLVPVYIGVTTNAFDAVKDIKGAIGSIASSMFQTPVKRAGGGEVHGPGTSTSDSIHALLSDDEHVLTAEDVHLAGGHEAIYAWRKSLRSQPPGFRDGGQVDVLGSRPASWRRARLQTAAVQAFANGGAVHAPSVSLGLDVGRLSSGIAAAYARLAVPNISVVSGEDAATAAEAAMREFLYYKDKG